MYNQRKRKIFILIIVIILALAILSVSGYFIYAKTDLFKSNKNLFFKYASQVIESIKFEGNKQLAEIEDLQKVMPYQTEAKLMVGNEDNKNIQLKMDAKINKAKNQEYRKFDLLTGSQSIFNVEYAKSNNIYALKSDEIVNAFIGIENDNLKVLAQKLGIKDTTAIPNSINENNYNWHDYYKISEEEKAHLKKTYTEALLKEIKDSNFSKEKNFAVAREGVNYNTTAYRLTLSAEDTQHILLKILETLKEDSITLNLIATKASQAGLDENYTNVNNLTKKIQEKIDNIKKNNLYTVPITIMIYVNNMEPITTEIIYNNEQKYTIYCIATENSNTRYLLIENLNANETLERIEIKQNETRNAGESNYNVFIKLDKEIDYNINIKLNGNKESKIFNIDGTINVNNKNDSFDENYTQKIIFDDNITEDIIKLDRTNCGVLNDYTKEQVEYIIQAIVERTKVVWTQKAQILNNYFSTIIGNNALVNNVQRTITNDETLSSLSDQEKAAFNAKFEAFKGTIRGSNLKALRNMVENSNLNDMENQITLYIDAQRSFGDNVNIDSNATYNVQMEYDEDTGFIVQINANKI